MFVLSLYRDHEGETSASSCCRFYAVLALDGGIHVSIMELAYTIMVEKTHTEKENEEDNNENNVRDRQYKK